MKNIFGFKSQIKKRGPVLPVKSVLADNNGGQLDPDNLKDSEIRYRRLFETAKDGILILDFETGNIVDANPYIIEIIDYPLTEVKGRKLWEIGLFSNKEDSENAFAELKSKGYIRFDDMPIQQRNGKITEVEFISNVYSANKSKVIQCNIRNITERKAQERKQELTTRILSILNVQDNLQHLVKDILDEIRGYWKMEQIGIRLTKLTDYPSEVTNCLFDSYLGKSDEGTTLQQSSNAESILVGQLSVQSVCNMVVSGNTDRALPYFTPNGSFYCNKSTDFADPDDGQPVFQSMAVIPLYSGKEIIGVLQLSDPRPNMLTLQLVRFFEELANTIGIAFSRIRNETKIKENEQDLIRQNASYVTLNRDYITLNKALTSSIERVSVMNRKLVVAKVRAEESDRLKSAFLANMSHEIRTPLNAIVGFSGFLTETGLSHEKRERYVQIINTSSSQLLSVISDVLDISQIEAGQMTINSELVDVNRLLSDVFLIYKQQMGLKGVRFNYLPDKPNDSVAVMTDGNRIKQVVCNLINNAMKFTNEGAIEFGYKVRPEFIEFYVNDTGIGIDPENLTNIFQRFMQIESANSRMQGGNGLGLSISKAVVEKLGGTISVISELGEGARFKFTIPYNRHEVVAEGEIIDPQIVNSDSWTGKTVLVVEDEENNHEYINELLMDANVNVLHAWDGKEAVDLVEGNNQISLVLMDLKMPVMNGYDATRIIKRIRPQLPVIAQTAYSLNEEKTKVLQAGFDNYIIKPIAKDTLMGVFSYYLNPTP